MDTYIIVLSFSREAGLYIGQCISSTHLWPSKIVSDGFRPVLPWSSSPPSRSKMLERHLFRSSIPYSYEKHVLSASVFSIWLFFIYLLVPFSLDNLNDQMTQLWPETVARRTGRWIGRSRGTQNGTSNCIEKNEGRRGKEKGWRKSWERGR